MTEEQTIVRLPESKIANGFSRRKDLQECTRLYYEKHIAKTLPFVDSEFSLLGKAVHDHLHVKLQAGIKILDAKELHMLCVDKMQDYDPALLYGIQRAYGYVTAETGLKFSEQDWALTKDEEAGTFKPCPWMGKGVFDRAQIDVACLNDTECSVHDYKSGKAKNTRQNQLEDYAIHVFFRFPHVKKVSTTFHMMLEPDRDARVMRCYTRKDMEIRKRLVQWIEMDKEVRDRNARGDWPDTPGTQCGWCDASNCGSHPSNAY